MLLGQDSETKYWTVGVDADGVPNGFKLMNTHDPALCSDRGCAIHNHPTDHILSDAPMLWREDRGILERLCEHGIGHPDHDSAGYLASIGAGFENIHGCDGCC